MTAGKQTNLTVIENNDRDLIKLDFGVDEDVILDLRQKYLNLKAIDAKSYKGLTKAVSEVRTFRTSIEKIRKAEKSKITEIGKAIDAEAYRLSSMISEIEMPLQQEKERYDIEEKQRKAEAEKLERDRIQKILERLERIKNAPLKHQGKTADELKTVIQQFKVFCNDDKHEYGEFANQVSIAKKLSLESLEGMHESRLKFEADKAELDKQRAELDAEKAKFDVEKINSVTKNLVEKSIEILSQAPDDRIPQVIGEPSVTIEVPVQETRAAGLLKAARQQVATAQEFSVPAQITSRPAYADLVRLLRRTMDIALKTETNNPVRTNPIWGEITLVLKTIDEE